MRPLLRCAALLVLAFSLAGASAVRAADGRATVDPRDITLVDQSGAHFRLRDLAGRPSVVTFVASRCTDACPIANAMFLRTYQRLRHERIAARLVTVTLDPDYDTPFVMAGVARRFDVARDRWRFASGRPDDVKGLMRSLGVSARPDKAGVPEEHSSFVYVLDRHVRLAQTLLLSTGSTDEIVDAVRHR